MSSESQVHDNKTRNRFELVIDGVTAFAEYETADGVVTLTHTEVPDRLGGRGVGSALARGALDALRRDGRKVAATCPFMAAFLKKHSEYNDLTTAA